MRRADAICAGGSLRTGDLLASDGAMAQRPLWVISGHFAMSD